MSDPIIPNGGEAITPIGAVGIIPNGGSAGPGSGQLTPPLNPAPYAAPSRSLPIVQIWRRSGKIKNYGNSVATYTDAERGLLLAEALNDMAEEDALRVSNGNYLAAQLGGALKSRAHYYFDNSRLYIDENTINGPNQVFNGVSDAYSDSFSVLAMGIDGVEHVTVDGKLTIDGNGYGSTDKFGMSVFKAKYSNFKNIFVTGMNKGLAVEGSLNPLSNRVGMVFENIQVDNCVTGIYTSTEYNKFIGCGAYGCSTGLNNYGGNNEYYVEILNNHTGVRLQNSGNDGHGWIGGNINHNTAVSLIVEHGHNHPMIIEANIYGNAGSVVDISGNGVTFKGGHFASDLISGSGLTGVIDFQGVNFNSDDTPAQMMAGLSAGDLAKVHMRNCRNKTSMLPDT